MDSNAYEPSNKLITLQNFAHIPAELQACPNWVCWRLEVDEQSKEHRMTKRPYNPRTGHMAKSNNPNTWVNFQTAVQAASHGKYNGIGFMFSNSPYSGIDIDHCGNADNLSDYAKNIIARANSYTEISQSGSGIHIIVKGKPQDPKGRRGGVLEVYSDKRYFALTGNIFDNHKDITADAGLLDALIAEIDAKKQANKPMPPPVNVLADKRSDTVVFGLTDEQLIKKISKSKNSDNFNALFFQGNISAYDGDDSAADAALMAKLVWWTNHDMAQSLRIFGQSALGQRDKWKLRQDYQERTFAAADIYVQGGYTPQLPKQKKRKKPQDAANTQNSAVTNNEFVYNIDWPDQEETKEGFKPLRVSWRNVQVLMDKLNITAKYNLLTNEVDFFGSSLEKSTFDSAITFLRWVAHINGLKISERDMCACVGLLAEQAQYNPVCTYLDSLKGKWDGQDHIPELFAAFHLDPEQEQDPQFLQMLLRRWLIGCVVMAYNDGREAAQGLLILKGPQGRSKSRFLSQIVPDYRWVQDGSILDPADKDSKLDNLRYWIAELGEFGATLRRDKLEILKAFITRRTDTIRRPYARASRQEPRRTTFFGTINDDTFLKDITGDRRYWVIAVTHVDLDVIEVLDIDQLWAQIVHYVCEVEHKRENEDIYRHWLTTEEIDLLEAHNRQYKKISAEEQAMRDMLDWDAPVDAWQEYTVTELCDKFCLTKKSMTMLGLTIKAIAKNDKRIGLPKNHRNRVYKLPPMSKI